MLISLGFILCLIPLFDISRKLSQIILLSLFMSIKIWPTNLIKKSFVSRLVRKTSLMSKAWSPMLGLRLTLGFPLWSLFPKACLDFIFSWLSVHRRKVATLSIILLKLALYCIEEKESSYPRSEEEYCTCNHPITGWWRPLLGRITSIGDLRPKLYG